MGGLSVVRREPTYGGSRLDFLLGDGSERLLLEVKSCTLVEEGVALFPDAPTERGTRHLMALESFLGEGRASVLFLIQSRGLNKKSISVKDRGNFMIQRAKPPRDFHTCYRSW
jgi:sugar fermentation stimulation protein A